MEDAKLIVTIDSEDMIDMSVEGLPHDIIAMVSYVIDYLIDNGVVSGLTYSERRFVVLKEIFKNLEYFRKNKEQESVGNKQ